MHIARISYRADAHIYSTDLQEIGTTEEMKALGLYFSNRPNCTRHVLAIRKLFCGKYWLLIDLKQNQLREAELLKVYKTYQTNSSCLLYTSPSPRDRQKSRMPSSA